MANLNATIGHYDRLMPPAGLLPTVDEQRRSLGLVPKQLRWEWAWLVASFVVGIPLAWFTLRPPFGVGPNMGTLLLASLCFGLFLGLAIYLGTGVVRLMLWAVGTTGRT